jgi:hypothetical protein
MPVTCPSTSEVNFTPSSTEDVSALLDVVGVTDAGQMVQAEHPPAVGVTAVEGVEAGPVPTALVAVTVKV